MKSRLRVGPFTLSLCSRLACAGSVLALCAAGVFASNTASGAIVPFEFDDGSPLDNTGPGASMVVDGLTLTTIDVGGPIYDPDFPIWDGVTTGSDRMNIPSTGGLAVNGPNPAPSSDTSRWDVGEYWIFAFDAPVIFRHLGLTSFNTDGDMLEIAVSSDNFLLIGSVDGNLLDDPFGASYVIPAGTEITFRNPPASGGDPVHEDWWKVRRFTVQTVPEPSSFMLMAIAVLGAGCARMRRKK